MPNFREILYNVSSNIRRIKTPSYFRQLEHSDRVGDQRTILAENLGRLFQHCRDNVPYYKQFLATSSIDPSFDPFRELHKLPILTKSLIRDNFESLKSADLGRRSWYFNTSGGSTGEPVRFIQDKEFAERSTALTNLYSHWIGCDYGERQLLLWGSERDLFYGKPPLKTRWGNWLRNTQTLNAFHMTPERMRKYVEQINQFEPQLVIAYAQAIYELAIFAERESLSLTARPAVITSAGTLYPFMREKIEQVFGCAGRVFNRYGSREVGLIACERPGYSGLVASPESNYIEIVDDEGNLVPPGTEGEIVVTNLLNEAMPLLRYAIGDRGVMADPAGSGGSGRQILSRVLGRNVDAFQTTTGGLIDGEYFTHLLYFRPWLNKFQVIQKTPLHLVYKLVLNPGTSPSETDLQEIREKSRLVLGEQLRIDFEYPPEINPGASGKYRYTISEIAARTT